MPVVSTVERVSRVVRETLDRLASEDDIVEFAVHIDVEEADPEDAEAARGAMGEEVEPCPGCGNVHINETVVAIFISLDCPETNSRSQSHWYTPIRNTYDDADLVTAVEETWDRITSRRLLYGLEQGITATASHDEVPAPAEGKD